MPNLCGVNQKQLSDALYEIKRGSHTGASVPPNLNSIHLGTTHSLEATRASSQPNFPQNGGVGNKFKAFFRNSHTNFETEEE